jgi:DNA-binding response OmpR family regulator
MGRTTFCPSCRSAQPATGDHAGDRSALVCAGCGAPIGEPSCEGGTPSSGRPTVLCIDDDPFVLSFYVSFLEPRGYRTLTAEDGLLGIEIATREHPDVILLDVLLRGLSGFDICRKLREVDELHGTPIILLTVLDEPGISITGRAAGATIILRKASGSEMIVTAIEQVLGRNIGPALL